MSFFYFRVCINPYNWCGTCYYCTRGQPQFCISEAMRTAYGYQKNGGMQKYCVVPAQLVHAVPSTMSLKQAVFCQPLSTIVRGWDNMGHVESDSKVLIAGAGLHFRLISFSLSNWFHSNFYSISGKKHYSSFLSSCMPEKSDSST